MSEPLLETVWDVFGCLKSIARAAEECGWTVNLSVETGADAQSITCAVTRHTPAPCTPIDQRLE